MTEKLKLFEFGTPEQVMDIYKNNPENQESLVFSLISTLKVLEGRCTDKDVAYEQQAVELAKADSQGEKYKQGWEGALEDGSKCAQDVSDLQDMLKEMGELRVALKTAKESYHKLIDENADLKECDKNRQRILEAHGDRIAALRSEIDELERTPENSEIIKLCEANKDFIKKLEILSDIQEDERVTNLRLIEEQKETKILRNSIEYAELALKYKEVVIGKYQDRLHAMETALHHSTGDKIENEFHYHRDGNLPF